MMIKALAFAVLFAAVADAACSNACSGHGTCGEEDLCKCFPRWTSPDCSTRECPYGPSWVAQPKTDASQQIGPATGALGGRHGYTVCSSKGKCGQDSGECECFIGYTGLACSRQSCPEDCSGHGRCITNLQADSKYTYQNKFVSEFWDADMTRLCTCDRGWQGYACAKRICPVGADPLTCEKEKNEPTVQRITLDNMDFPFEATAKFKVAITLKFKDMFNGEYTTQPIRLKGRSRGLKSTVTIGSDTIKIRTCAGSEDSARCAAVQTGLRAAPPTHTPSQCDLGCVFSAGSLPLVQTDDTCTINPEHMQSKCSQSGAWTALNQYDNNNGDPFVAGAGIRLENFDANRIRYALESLPNFAIPSVNVTDVYPLDGDSTDVDDIRYNTRWYFDVTFSHPANAGAQELMSCTVASPATDNAAASPRMGAPTIWEHTNKVTQCFDACTSGTVFQVNKRDDLTTPCTGGKEDTCTGYCKWTADLTQGPEGGYCAPEARSCLRDNGYGKYVCDGAVPGVAILGVDGMNHKGEACGAVLETDMTSCDEGCMKNGALADGKMCSTAVTQPTCTGECFWYATGSVCGHGALAVAIGGKKACHLGSSSSNCDGTCEWDSTNSRCSVKKEANNAACASLAEGACLAGCFWDTAAQPPVCAVTTKATQCTKKPACEGVTATAKTGSPAGCPTALDRLVQGPAIAITTKDAWARTKTAFNDRLSEKCTGGDAAHNTCNLANTASTCTGQCTWDAVTHVCGGVFNRALYVAVAAGVVLDNTKLCTASTFQFVASPGVGTTCDGDCIETCVPKGIVAPGGLVCTDPAITFTSVTCTGDCTWDAGTSTCTDTDARAGGGSLCSTATVSSDCDGSCKWGKCVNDPAKLHCRTATKESDCAGTCSWAQAEAKYQPSVNVDQWWSMPVALNPKSAATVAKDNSQTTKCASVTDKSLCNEDCNWAPPIGASAGVCSAKTLIKRDAPTCTVSAITKPNPATKYVCSNRGVCDGGTGLCSCFEGYAGEDCALQNIYF